MSVASPRTITTVRIIMEIGTHVEDNIVLAVSNPQTMNTVKRSMIDKVNFVQTAVILQNMATVKVMNRGDLIAIFIMGGEQVVKGEIHGVFTR